MESTRRRPDPEPVAAVVQMNIIINTFKHKPAHPANDIKRKENHDRHNSSKTCPPTVDNHDFSMSLRPGPRGRADTVRRWRAGAVSRRQHYPIRRLALTDRLVLRDPLPRPPRHLAQCGISGDTSAGAVRRLQWDVLEREHLSKSENENGDESGLRGTPSSIVILARNRQPKERENGGEAGERANPIEGQLFTQKMFCQA